MHNKTGYEQYPIVDDVRAICGIFTAKEILSTKLPNAVILMAGGIDQDYLLSQITVKTTTSYWGKTHFRNYLN